MYVNVSQLPVFTLREAQKRITAASFLLAAIENLRSYTINSQNIASYLEPFSVAIASGIISVLTKPAWRTTNSQDILSWLLATSA